MKRSNKILCIVAHPDDEALGIGGTLIKHVDQGDHVYIVILSDGEGSKTIKNQMNKNRLKNAKKWSNSAGTKLFKILNLPDQKFDTTAQLDLVKELEIIIKKIKPDIVYTHFLKDINRDHQITAEATLVALRPMSIKNPKAEIRLFETPSSTDQTPQLNEYSFTPNLYVNITKYWKKKSTLLKFYSKELRTFPHPRSVQSIKALAIKRGSESGLELAEAFFILRKIIE